MNMKKIILFFIAGTIALRGHGQDIRVNVYGNYVFDDRVEAYYSNTNYFSGTIKGGLLWGLGLEYKAHKDFGVELLYLHQTTNVLTDYFDYTTYKDKTTKIDLNLNYLMAGTSRYQQLNEKTEVYAGLLFGLAFIHANNPEGQVSADATKFAWGLKLGSNFWVSDKLAIKIQTQLISVVQSAGGGLYFGTGGGGATVTAFSSMLQFSLVGGLCIRLGK